MALCAWVFFFLLLALFFNYWSKEYRMNTHPKTLIVNGIKKTIIKRNAQNQYISDGFVNDKPVLFLLDTGATEVVVPGKLAQSLQLKQGLEGVASTAGGHVRVYDTRINNLKVGNIELTEVNAVINPSMSGEEILLGMSALRRVTLMMDGDNLIITNKQN